MNYPQWLKSLGLGLLLFTLIGCTNSGPVESEAKADLRRCTLSGGRVGQCGSLTVPENRDNPAGSARELEIAYIVLPATGGVTLPDPVFFLAGGPGQAAIELAPIIAVALSDIHRSRDFVFVDQRGTGQSNRLSCEFGDEAIDLDEEAFATLLSDCRQTLSESADLSQYTTDIAMADLDGVRAALGYETINLIGVSYGTRAAQTYMRLFPDRTRRAVLDAVVSSSLVLNLQSATTGQRALDLFLLRCAQDSACQTAFPTLDEDIETLLSTLENPQPVTFPNALTGAPVTIELSRDDLMRILFNLLYSADATSLLPLKLNEAAASGDFGPFLAFADATIGSSGGDEEGGIYIGMHYAVTCTEDAPLIDLNTAEMLADDSIFPSNAPFFLQNCDGWPTGTLPADFREPLQSDIPTLLLSGEIDPITPPEYGDEVAKTLERSLHLTLPGFGHGQLTHFDDCIPGLVNDFLSSETPIEIDTTCLETVSPPPFFVDYRGTNP